MRGYSPNLKPRSAPAPRPEEAAAFRARLRALGLSQAWLAERLGKAPHTVGKWASGDLRVPEYAVFVLDLLAAIREAEKKLHDLTEST